MTKRSLFLLAALAAPALAAAQTTGFTLTETNSANQDNVINIAECNGASSDIVISWAGSDQAATTFNLWVSNTAFSSTASTTSCDTAGSTATGAVHVSLQSGIPFSGAGAGRYPPGSSTNAKALMTSAGILCTATTQNAIYFCVEPVGGTTQTILIGSTPVDLSIPDAPGSVSAVAGDSHITLHWATVGSPVPTTITSTTVITNTVRGYQLFAVTQGGTFSTTPNTTVNSQGLTSGDVQGLTNGVAYDLAVRALSGGGNPGTMSATVTGTPALVYDFWRTYKVDGGTETGGCGTGGFGLAALLGLVPLAVRRAARRKGGRA